MVLPSAMNRARSAFKKNPALREQAIVEVATRCSDEEILKAGLKACKMLKLPPEYAEKAKNQILRREMDSKIEALDKQIEELKAQKVELEKERASVDTVVTVIVMLLVAAILIPVALSLLSGANTTGWTTTNITIFGLLGTIAMVAIILKFLRQVKET